MIIICTLKKVVNKYIYDQDLVFTGDLPFISMQISAHKLMVQHTSMTAYVILLISIGLKYDTPLLDRIPSELC